MMVELAEHVAGANEVLAQAVLGEEAAALEVTAAKVAVVIAIEAEATAQAQVQAQACVHGAAAAGCCQHR